MHRLHAGLFSVLALGLGVAGAGSCALLAGQVPGARVVRAGQIRSDAITEASGLAASWRNPGILWVHNDSGDKPRVYAVNEQGDLLATFDVTGAQARDWEDIAIGPGPDPNSAYLYIGDIGDNAGRYPSIQVYRVPEPSVDAAWRSHKGRTLPAERIDLRYADGPRDAEALLVDPVQGDLYVISKRDLFSRVYRHAGCVSLTETNRLDLVCVLPLGLVTAGDVSRDGAYVVVRSPNLARIWHRPQGEALWKAFGTQAWSIPLGPEPQGEAICFDPTGRWCLTVSEGKGPVVYRVGPVGVSP